LRPGECFSVQITVHHKFRGKGLGTDLRQRIFASMKEAGYRRIYGGTQITNTANKALTRKVGFKEFAIAAYTRFFGYKKLKISRVSR
jgi:L-amino acid N-acyltransferase YncA